MCIDSHLLFVSARLIIEIGFWKLKAPKYPYNLSSKIILDTWNIRCADTLYIRIMIVHYKCSKRGIVVTLPCSNVTVILPRQKKLLSMFCPWMDLTCEATKNPQKEQAQNLFRLNPEEAKVISYNDMNTIYHIWTGVIAVYFIR